MFLYIHKYFTNLNMHLQIQHLTKTTKPLIVVKSINHSNNNNWPMTQQTDLEQFESNELTS